MAKAITHPNVLAVLGLAVFPHMGGYSVEPPVGWECLSAIISQPRRLRPLKVR